MNDNIKDTIKKKRGGILIAVLGVILGVGAVGTTLNIQVVEGPENALCIAAVQEVEAVKVEIETPVM